MTSCKSALMIALPGALALLMGGCTRAGEITVGGITAVRSACPVVGVPAATGDVTLFSPETSNDESAIDVAALITNVRSTCADMGEDVVTSITFDVRARRTVAAEARDVVLPYFITVVQGGSAVIAKSVSRVNVHFDAGQLRASVSGQGQASVARSAATLPDSVRKTLLRPRKAGEEDAAVDPLSRRDIRDAVQRASFEALVGFQLTDAQLKYNATR